MQWQSHTKSYQPKKLLCKIPKYHSISWSENFVERHSFCRVSGDSLETLRKLCLSTNFPHQKISWNCSILRSEPLKKVNNTPTIRLWQWLTCQNCQMFCRPYYWHKHQANISPLTLTMQFSRTSLYFLSALTVPDVFYQVFQQFYRYHPKQFSLGDLL